MGEPSSTQSGDRASVPALEAEIQALEQRLRRGEEILRQRREAGDDRDLLARYEREWVKLLRQYEILCDRLQRQQAYRQSSPVP